MVKVFVFVCVVEVCRQQAELPFWMMKQVFSVGYLLGGLILVKAD